MCVFCDIVSGATAAHLVYRDDTSLAFLDHRPLFAGHSLLAPKAHYETLTDIPEDLIPPFFSAAQELAGAVERAMGAHGSFVAINNRISQSVPHLHVHIVPRRRKDGLRGFFWPRSRYESEDEMARVAGLIRAELRDGHAPS